jgi:uncharacterized membrane protein YqjE
MFPDVQASAGEGIMSPQELQDPQAEPSMVDLVKEAFTEATALIKTELALAREEAEQQLAEAKRTGILIGLGAATAILGLSMLLVAMVLAISPSPLPALITGAVLLAGTAVVGFIAYRSRPQKPLPHTQERLREDLDILNEPDKHSPDVPNRPLYSAQRSGADEPQSEHNPRQAGAGRRPAARTAGQDAFEPGTARA